MADTENTGAGKAVVSYERRLDEQSLRSVDAVEETRRLREEAGAKNLFQCEMGPVLRLKKFPTRLVIEATSKLEDPKVPVTYIENKGRNEENPSDPQYLRDKLTYNVKLVTTLNRINFGFGTDVVELGGCEDNSGDEWADNLKDLMELEIPAVGTKSRYVMWLQYFVLTDDETNRLNMAITEYNTGVKVEDVAAAEASFPGVPGEHTDTGSVPASNGEQPGSGGWTSGADTGVRTEGSGPVRTDDVDDVPVAGV